MEEAICEAGLEEVKEYLLKRNNMVTLYISMQLIMDLCEEAMWRLGGTHVSKWWW